MGLSIEPVSRSFGLDRGMPIDRYYIEQFLQKWSDDVRGVVLEISDNAYTRRFGGEAVIESHVLSLDPKNPDATMVADLTSDYPFPQAKMDCIICTQTLQFIFDVPKAIERLWTMLRPGGVLLVTAPGISQIARYDMDHWGEHWRFTTMSLERLLSKQFSGDKIEVDARGNVMASTGFLYGLPTSDLSAHELDAVDPDYQLLITARAVKD